MLLIVSVENLACNVRNVSEKVPFGSKVTFVVLVYIAYKEIISMSLEVAFPHFSRISLQTFDYNVCSNKKKLRLSKKKSFISAI